MTRLKRLCLFSDFGRLEDFDASRKGYSTQKSFSDGEIQNSVWASADLYSVTYHLCKNIFCFPTKLIINFFK